MNVHFESTPKEGVSFHEYANLSVSQRAAIAARLTAEAKACRKAWMFQARASFLPSEREACAVCGQYQSITHAHHIYPLTQQFMDGRAEPCHDHVWLCPTHHAVVHEMIAGLLKNSWPTLEGVPPTERDECDRISLLFIKSRQRA